ncbi:hypothetical protein PGT21_016615 [Puccinia graminis f. sp. tritici]|uniref:Uncharacterized protein n=1 Tax=Puccinia graminis f. sp. tritici TaxID=56615 RepID=A0A5B0MVJ9_PUCGR|nr:hypothetical protein PGT21_016615 [Puccinia graminis f. sp. tritici]
MPKALTYRKDGALAQSTRTRNKQNSPILPSSNAPVCQALYDFLRLLLGIKKASDLVASSPGPERLAQFNCRSWDSEFLKRSKALLDLHGESPTTGNSPLYGKKKTLHESNRTTFLQHLDEINFPYAGFNWNEESSSAWNVTFSELILQHWNHARFAGAFLAYPMDPRAADSPSTMLALIIRWFTGRQDRIRREERNPGSAQRQQIMVQKSQQRLTLSTHRTDTLKMSKVADKFHGIFEDPLCNSDSEKQADGTLVKVPLKWRSQNLSALAARIDQLTIRRKQEENRKMFGPGQLLESRRQTSMANLQSDRKERVPRGLPKDFYDEQFFDGLGNQAQFEMCSQLPLGLSDLCLALDKKHTHSQKALTPSISTKSTSPLILKII